ncbi:permease [Nocardioides bizhenqiangii]|uniref:Permease n=1 Tax=Nocardioides bizhenqiangii TaxID=3095076 RepID=A0ABZ0ZPU4_9ACTN|nr:permease [Nocardioides sp. HM61]WQQ26381.1 permease [Nocardioides sp. HM61]
MTTEAPPQRDMGVGSQSWLVVGLLAAAFPLQSLLGSALDNPAFQTWATIFLAIVVQSVPFLVFGVVLSGIISAVLSERFVARVMPQRPALAVPVAGFAGVGLPACECAVVPIANSLTRRGLPPAVALTFMLAAPAVNPAVLVSTAVAFSGRMDMVSARFLASMLTAVVIGWIYVWATARFPALHLPDIRERFHQDEGSRWARFAAAAWHDFLPAAGFLVLGAVVAAAINVWVPIRLVEAVADNALFAVVALTLFAFVIALCSEADAFVAASLTAFSDTAKLVFLVVGPAMDIKLAAMEAGQFGRKFAQQFVPLVLVVAASAACLIGWVIL